MSKHHSFHECIVCRRWYFSEEAATACEKQPEWPEGAPQLVPGDIVVVRYGWTNNAWTQKPQGLDKEHGNCFGVCCRPFPYYVVGAVEVEQVPPQYIRDAGFVKTQQHRIKYHVHTLAEGKAVGGYTFNKHHYPPVKVEPQPKLRGAEKLIGMRAEHLL